MPGLPFLCTTQVSSIHQDLPPCLVDNANGDASTRAGKRGRA